MLSDDFKTELLVLLKYWRNQRMVLVIVW